MFFSAVLAGYFAWRTVRSSPEADINSLSDDSPNDKTSLKDEDESNFTRVCFNLFITFGFASFFFVSFFFLSFFLFLPLFTDVGFCRIAEHSKWFLGICRHGQWEILVEESQGD